LPYGKKSVLTTKNPMEALQQTTVQKNQVTLAKGGNPNTYYQLFQAAQANDIKTLKYLLDLGVPIDVADFDTGSTALHWACAKSQQHAVRLLVERGANVNAQNKRGLTPLHSLIINRIEPLAFWLIKKGADLRLTDVHGKSSVCYALPWTQKEMEELFARVQMGVQDEVVQKPQYNPEPPRVVQNPPRPETTPEPQEPPEQKEVLRVFLKNDAYKSVVASNKTIAKDLSDTMAEKLNLGADFAPNLEVLERVKKGDRYLERRLDPNTKVLELRTKWPLIIGPSGNETHLHCRFIVHTKRGASISTQNKFRDAIYGTIKQ